MKKKEIELISVTVKIDGKKKVFKKENVRFHGWEAECDLCGSHGGVTIELIEKGNTVGRIDLEEY